MLISLILIFVQFFYFYFYFILNIIGKLILKLNSIFIFNLFNKSNDVLPLFSF